MVLLTEFLSGALLPAFRLLSVLLKSFVMENIAKVVYRHGVTNKVDIYKRGASIFQKYKQRKAWPLHVCIMTYILINRRF